MKPGTGPMAFYDQVKQAVRLKQTDPQHYISGLWQRWSRITSRCLWWLDKVPMGAAMNKGLTFKMGQTHVHRYLRPLLEHIEWRDRSIFRDYPPPEVGGAPHGYEIFKHKRQLHQGCFETVKHWRQRCVRYNLNSFLPSHHHPSCLRTT